MIRYKFVSAIVLFIAVLGISCSAAKTGYHIKVNIEGIKDTTTILAYYYGASQYVKDTAIVDNKGFFEFTGEESLDKGMYMIVLPGDRYFDIIVDKDQHFEIKTEADNLVGAMEVSGSPENDSFYNYMRQLRPLSESMSELRQKIMELEPDDKQHQELRNRYSKLEREAEKLKADHINNFPDGLFTAVLKAQEDVPIPDAPLNEDGMPDRKLLYLQYIEDYWKNIDFSDDRLIRTPVYHQKLNHFFSSVVIQIPDSIVSAADFIIEKSRAHDENFKYTLWFAMNFSDRSNIMGIDKLFVHLADNYYLKGEADWISEDRLEAIAKRAETLRPLLIGAKAPDMEVFTPEKEKLSLHSVDAKYTVIYFWDSECSHCKRVTPQLKDVYERLKETGLEVFAMNVEADRNNWLNAVEKYNMNWINVHDPVNESGFRDKYDIYSIPIIYVLDENKKILAKKINPEQVENLIQHMEMQ